jgi:hypothetical protein
LLSQQFRSGGAARPPRYRVPGHQHGHLWLSSRPRIAHRASRIAVAETCAALEQYAQLERVIFVCFDSETYQAYLVALA